MPRGTIVGFSSIELALDQPTRGMQQSFRLVFSTLHCNLAKMSAAHSFFSKFKILLVVIPFIELFKNQIHWREASLNNSQPQGFLNLITQPQLTFLHLIFFLNLKFLKNWSIQLFKNSNKLCFKVKKGKKSKV